MTARRLTQGEIALAKTLFKDSIDYDSVRIHDKKYVFFQPNNSGMTPNGEIYISGKSTYKDDYSKASEHMKAFFLHEMTHVWQYQNKVLDPVAEAMKENVKHKFNYAAAYPYEIDVKKDLTDYGMEQQASIVEHYYLISKGRRDPGRAGGYGYKKVLKKFLDDPKYARRAEFPTGASPKHTKHKGPGA